VSQSSIDQGIRWLEDALAAVSSTMLELETDTHWLMLERAPVTGATDLARAHAREALKDVWQRYGELSDVLEEAKTHRDKSAHDTRASEAARQLLWGESVVVQVTSVDVANRALFSPATAIEKCTPEAALRSMSQTYEAVRSAVADVSIAWGEWAPRVGAARRRAEDQASLARALDDDSASWAAAVTTRLAGLADRLLTDPLSVEGGEVDAAVAEADALVTRLASARETRARIEATLLAGEARLAELREAASQSRAASDAVAAKIVLPEGAAVSRTHVLADLTADWERVGTLVEDGSWLQVQASVAAWNKRANAAAEALAAAPRTGEQLLRRRGDLRGLLTAYDAKAARLGLAEHAAISAAYEHARALLYTAPCDLDAAEEAVRRLGSAIASEEGAR